MRRIFSRSRWGILGIMPLLLLLGGCGWEPLIPDEGPNPGQTPPSPQLQVEIVYECPQCVQPAGGAAPLTFTFQAKVTLPDPQQERVLVYSWDFGDGTKDEGERVTHTFQKPGTYQVGVRVITSTGAEARALLQLVVQEPLQPQLSFQRDFQEGEFCSFERILPEAIRVGERFKVQVTIKIKQDAQVVMWEDDVWFPEFRLFQEPATLWIGLKAGETKVLLYEVQLWQAPTLPEVWMSGTLSCNVGGNSQSETLTLKSKLNIVE